MKNYGELRRMTTNVVQRYLGVFDQSTFAKSLDDKLMKALMPATAVLVASIIPELALYMHINSTMTTVEAETLLTQMSQTTPNAFEAMSHLKSIVAFQSDLPLYTQMRAAGMALSIGGFVWGVAAACANAMKREAPHDERLKADADKIEAGMRRGATRLNGSEIASLMKRSAKTQSLIREFQLQKQHPEAEAMARLADMEHSKLENGRIMRDYAPKLKY